MKAALREVIQYLVNNAKYPPTKTSLIKLIYMADYYHLQMYGEQLTNCEYKLQRYGAVCFDISDTATKMDGSELKVKTILYPSAYQIMYENIEKPFSPTTLSTEQKEILDIVISRHSNQSLPALKKAHYETEPMKNVKQQGERLNMKTIKRVAQTKNNTQIRALQSHIMNLKLTTAGSAEERAVHYKTIVAATAPARKRANTACLRKEH